MRRWPGRLARQRGFTLVELVIVMTIIGILAGALTLHITHRVENARRARAVADIATLETALSLYEADNGGPPTTQQGLAALRQKPSSPPLPRNWDGPYLRKAVSQDPWGHEYVYRYPGQYNPESYDIMSYGDDGQPGGSGKDEDVTNWE